MRSPPFACHDAKRNERGLRTLLRGPAANELSSTSISTPLSTVLPPSRIANRLPAYVAASNDHLELGADRYLRYTPTPRHSPKRASVDVLFMSTATHSARPGMAALLTGMGHDGAEGLL
jgi:hypothetical protein